MYLTIGISSTIVVKGWQITIEVESAVIVVDPHIEDGSLRNVKIDIQQTLQPVALYRFAVSPGSCYGHCPRVLADRVM
jgi:hypothetical protein